MAIGVYLVVTWVIWRVFRRLLVGKRKISNVSAPLNGSDNKSEYGCYMAELVVGGKYIDRKVFFPAEWTREEVVTAIYEVYEDFLKQGANAQKTHGGKYIVRGLSKRGVEIEMLISQDAVIETAYPLFNWMIEKE